MSIGHQRNRDAEQPFVCPTEDFVRFPRRQNGMIDIEGQLKRQLVELQQEYNRRAGPIISQLCMIESMRPPAPMVIDASMVDPAMLAQLRQNADKR